MEVLQKVELLRSEVRDALARFQVAPVVPLPREVQFGSVDEGSGCCFGEFSPRAQNARSSVLRTAVLTKVVAPAVEILSEPHDPFGILSVGLSSELGSLEPLAVGMAPSPSPPESCKLLSSVDSEGLVGSVTFSSLSDQAVGETNILAPNSESLFGKDICDLLVDLEAACPGYGKDIASVLAGTAAGGVVMKVEKSLRRRARKKLPFAWRSFVFS